jgi:hypothetical protein
MLEAEWRNVLRGSVSTGAKEDKSSTGRVYAAEFHHVTVRSRFAGVFLPNYLAQSDCLVADRQGQGDTRLTRTPYVIANSNYGIMVSETV